MDTTPSLNIIRLCQQFEQKLNPVIFQLPLELPRPTLKDASGDVDRILAELKKHLPAGAPAGDICVSLEVIRKVGGILREASFHVTAVLSCGERDWELLDLHAGTRDIPCYGLGIDIGTTILSLYLVDFRNGNMVGKAAVENPQIVHGEDILSRIHFCEKDGGLSQLQQLIVASINESLAALAAAAGIRPDNIYAAAVAGNPTMVHFLLGAGTYNLCRKPYVPAFNLPLRFKAKELRISACPDAPVYLLPSVGSYFGGDVVAGIVAAGMYRAETTSILVDVGTNAEIVIGNRDWYVACAGAAGPALESGGAKAGMRAVDGAIEKVRIEPETLEPAYEVIGGGMPEGICGSGIIDLVAQLYLAGALDSKGRINEFITSNRFIRNENVNGYMIASKRRGESESDIVIDESDVRNLLRAKGAMYTALSVITERLGVPFRELNSFYVAGSFGEHIEPLHAITIGMLPDIVLERFKVLGNSAGIGACLTLINKELQQVVEEIRRKSSYIQLTTDSEFMNRLSAAFFIPHTEKNLFPSVERRAEAHMKKLRAPGK